MFPPSAGTFWILLAFGVSQLSLLEKPQVRSDIRGNFDEHLWYFPLRWKWCPSDDANADDGRRPVDEYRYRFFAYFLFSVFKLILFQFRLLNSRYITGTVAAGEKEALDFALAHTEKFAEKISQIERSLPHTKAWTSQISWKFFTQEVNSIVFVSSFHEI